MNQVKGNEFLLRSWDVAGVSVVHTQWQGPGELGESKKELGFGEQASARMWAPLVPWLHSESWLDYCLDHGRPLMSMDGVERVRVTSADPCACRKCCHTTLSMDMENRDSGHLNKHSSLLPYFSGKLRMDVGDDQLSAPPLRPDPWNLLQFLISVSSKMTFP